MTEVLWLPSEQAHLPAEVARQRGAERPRDDPPGISRPSYILMATAAPAPGVSWTTFPSGKRNARTSRGRSQAGSICSSAGPAGQHQLPSSPMTMNSRSPITPYRPSRISLAPCSRMPLTGAIASWETVTGTVIPPALIMP